MSVDILVSFRKKVKESTCLEQLGSVLIEASEKLSANDYSYIDKLTASKALELDVDLGDLI